MNVLPKCLYLFQCIPLDLPKSIFKSIDKIFTSFKWDGKKPRIRLELLQRPRLQGGQALPNVCHYYWASNVKKSCTGSTLLIQAGAVLKLHLALQPLLEPWSPPAFPYLPLNTPTIR